MALSSAVLKMAQHDSQRAPGLESRGSWGDFRALLACPRCKADLTESSQTLYCADCGTHWPLVDGTPDFRPEYAPEYLDNWSRGQHEMETEPYTAQYALRNREGCREAYETLPATISGNFLDIGGADGTVRHFLPKGVHYLCVDPFIEAPKVARTRGEDSAFLEVFPCLAEPYPFLCAFAERLPLKSRQFDWVHLRSMLDHVYDPFETLMEALRCLRPGGHLILGLSARGGESKLVEPGMMALLARCGEVLRYEGVSEVLVRVGRRLKGHRDHHLRHPSIDELRCLLTRSNFEILREQWTTPPFDYVVYLLARRSQEAN